MLLRETSRYSWHQRAQHKCASEQNESESLVRERDVVKRADNFVHSFNGLNLKSKRVTSYLLQKPRTGVLGFSPESSA